MPGAPGEELLEEVAVVLGGRPRLVGVTERGESRSTFLISGPGPTRAVLKVVPEDGEALANHRRLVEIVERLRSRGYPAPEYLGVGAAAGAVFSVQRLIEGSTLESEPGARPEPSLLARLVPAILDAVELQAGQGDLARPPWPDWLVATITHGGDGYCMHETMLRRPDTAALLGRVQALVGRHRQAPVTASDVLHFDMSPPNIVHQDGRLAGIVDWNVPFAGATQGDRGFDLATLAFYAWDVPDVREVLWRRLLETSGAAWASVYLAHLCLRQVEWTIRHRPGGREESRFTAIARDVVGRCEKAGS